MKRILVLIMTLALVASVFAFPISATTTEEATKDARFLYAIEAQEFGIKFIPDNATYYSWNSYDTTASVGTEAGKSERTVTYNLTDGTVVIKQYSVGWQDAGEGEDDTTKESIVKFVYNIEVPEAGKYAIVVEGTGVRAKEDAAARGFRYSVNGSEYVGINIEEIISSTYDTSYSYASSANDKFDDANSAGDRYYGIGYACVYVDLVAGANTFEYSHLENASNRLNLAGFYVFPSNDGEIPAGTCGADLQWEIYDGKTLVISGTGDMNQYNTFAETPWNSYASAIEQVLVRKDVTSIDPNAFTELTNLKKISVPATLTSPFDISFLTGSKTIECIVIGSGVENIPENFMKDNTALYFASFGNSLKTVGADAFNGCTALKEFDFRSGLTTVGENAFKNNISLEEVYLTDSGVTSIGDSAFEGCTSNEKVSFGQFVESIGASAFKNNTALEKVNPTNSVKTIGASAFEGCAALKTVTLKKSLEAIGENAFKGCSAITKFTYPDTTAKFAEITANLSVVDSGIDVVCSDSETEPIVTTTEAPVVTTPAPQDSTPTADGGTSAEPGDSDNTTTKAPEGKGCGGTGTMIAFIQLIAIIGGTALFIGIKKK